MTNAAQDFLKDADLRLLRSSHSQGEALRQGGGCCVNEAAIVAAGFKYKSVGGPNSCPPCFSRPLAQYAISINDNILDDDLRHRLLLPFVTRLSGSADSPQIEALRVQFIGLQTVKKILPLYLRYLELESLALECENMECPGTVEKAVQLLEKVETVVGGGGTIKINLIRSLIYSIKAAFTCQEGNSTSTSAIHYLCRLNDGYTIANSKELFTAACEILAQALEIGNHAEIDPATALANIRKAKVST